MQMAAYDVPAGEATAQITEKKSRFIAHLARVSTEEEAAAFIHEKKKEYWDARHNCSAFVIGACHELTRCSDDGEPSGTAGRPMLEVLLGCGLHDTVVVVTRYFGGVLLGTGGLARAYSSVTQMVVELVKRAHVRYGCLFEITVQYPDLGKIENLLRGMGLQTDETDYGALVTLRLMVPQEQCGKLKKEITEGTGARAGIRVGNAEWYERV